MEALCWSPPCGQTQPADKLWSYIGVDKVASFTQLVCRGVRLCIFHRSTVSVHLRLCSRELLLQLRDAPLQRDNLATHCCAVAL